MGIKWNVAVQQYVPVSGDGATCDDPTIRLHSAQQEIQNLPANIVEVHIDKSGLPKVFLKVCVLVIEHGVASHCLEFGAFIGRSGYSDNLAFRVGKSNLRGDLGSVLICQSTSPVCLGWEEGRLTRPTEPAAPLTTTVSPSFKRPISNTPFASAHSLCYSEEGSRDIQSKPSFLEISIIPEF